MEFNQVSLPETGFVRLPQIIGNKKAKPPVPGLIPVSRAAWWDGIKRGLYPRGRKIGPRITAWKVEDIRALIDKLSEGQEA